MSTWDPQQTASVALAPQHAARQPPSATVSRTLPPTTDRATPHRAEPTRATPHRALVLWCPDWPTIAALRQERLPSTAPAILLAANRVRVTTAAARAEGIRVGMRKRDAQSRCPAVTVLDVDPDRDARMFEPVAAAVEELAPGIEILRPGLVACRVRGPARYFGSEIAAAESIVDAVEALDIECQVGIADGLSVAVLAARHSTIVPTGYDAAFCARLSLRDLARDPAIASETWTELVDLLQRLGITSAGALASLPMDKVASRFGTDGIALHRLASGTADRDMSRRRIDADLAVDQSCDPPLERVDAAAFAARALAEKFHARLAAAGLACTRLSITAVTGRGEKLTRVWRCTRPLTPAATADRLRWQLDGWLTGRSLTARRGPRRPAARHPGAGERPGVAGRLGLGERSTPGDRAGDRPGADAHPSIDEHFDDDSGAIVSLRLEAIEAVDAGRIQYALWGSDGRGEHRAGWAFARVQGLLGTDAVLSAAPAGGRGPSDRVATAAWGEENTPERDPAAPWPGALPAPAPTRATTTVIPGKSTPEGDRDVDVCDGSGGRILVTDRGLLTGPPTSVAGRRVLSWAGPWLVDERWWSGPVTAPARRSARLQVVTESGPPVLLGFGAHGWQLEAVYD